MRLRQSQALSQRPVKENEVPHVLNRELIPIVRSLTRTLGGGPTTFLWNPDVATIDVSSGGLFAAELSLSDDSTLILSGGEDGVEGSIFVVQDALGGRALTITANGRTTLRLDGDTDDNPNPDPDSVTRYDFVFINIEGTEYVVLEKRFLS